MFRVAVRVMVIVALPSTEKLGLVSVWDVPSSSTTVRVTLADVAAVRAADRAAAFATEHGFGRIRLAALIERSRALQLGDRVEESRDVLRRVLADSIAADDNVIRFYAHYYSWKAELMGGSSGRAEIELREAGYYLSFVDQTSPEAADVRAHAPPRS